MGDRQGMMVVGLVGSLTAGVVAAILFWPHPARPTPVAPVSVVSPAGPISTVTDERDQDLPTLVDLGDQPPDGVDPDAAYKRRQFEAFLTRQVGEPMQVTEAYDTSGSQVTTYCGSAVPVSGGPTRSWSIVLWSHAPMEHSISNEPAECDGLVLVKDGRSYSFDEAHALRQAELAPYRQAETAAPVVMISPGGSSMTGHIDRLSTYAVLIGRGAACGADIDGPSRRVGAWLDRIAPPGSQEQTTLLPMLMQQSRYHAQMQAAGQSPDDCGQVRRAIAGFDWP